MSSTVGGMDSGRWIHDLTATFFFGGGWLGVKASFFNGIGDVVLFLGRGGWGWVVEMV